jgi:hypothetical protein
MTFPIYYNGKILFRNGKPATSKDCCCGCLFDFDCIGNCWFPVAQPQLLTLAEYESQTLELQQFQVGGPTQIKNFYYEISTEQFGIAQYWTQVGTSTHAITARKCITDLNDPFSFGSEVVLRSRYFWFVPCEIVNGADEYQRSPDRVTVSYEPTVGWGFSVFNGTSGVFETREPIGVDECAGLIQFNWRIGELDLYFEFEVDTGLSLPAGFSCTDGIIFKNGRKFFGTKSSFPANYFPTS